MATVLIIGAGGSLSQAIDYRPKQKADYPPLDGNFFRRVSELGARHPDIRSAQNRLLWAIRQAGRFVNPWETTGVTLEQFFADVYYEVAAERSTKALKVFVRLLDLYVQTLEVTTNWMASKGRHRGLIGKLIEHEVEKSAPVTIITFNHDLVIENEIRRFLTTDDSWCLESLYGDIGLSPIYSPRPGVRFPHHQEKCSHSPLIKLLKLHGSLNWLLRTRKREPELGTLFPTSGTKSIFVDDDVQAAHVGVTIESGSRQGRTSWYGWPLLVPPIYDKQRIVGIGLLQKVWDQARDAIREAEKVVLVGYSLPDADFYARQMLRGSFADNPVDDVFCINPDASLATKLKSTLTCRVTRLYDDIGTYLNVGV